MTQNPAPRTVDRMKRASLYVRLSKQARAENLSLDGMVSDVEALAERLGYTVAALHVDDGYSGAVRDRPEFTAWLDDARHGRAEALLAYHGDRLTREGVNVAAMILDVVEGKDPLTGRTNRTPVRFASVDGLDSDDADAFRWRFVIIAEVARAERERMRERSRASRQRLDAAGRYHGGYVPFGLRVVTRDGLKVTEVDPAEAAVLKTVASRLLAGENWRAAVRWLNDEGVKTRRGKPWTRSGLRSLMFSQAARRAIGARTWRLLYDELATPRDRGEHTPSPVGRPARHLLVAGLGQCGSCGGNLVYHSSGYYFCGTKADAGPCPGPTWIKAQPVDDFLAEVFKERHGAEHPIVRRVRSNRDLDDAQAAYDAALADLTADPSPEHLDAYRVAMDRLQAEQGVPLSAHEFLVPAHETYAEVWDAADVPERQDLLRKVLSAPVRIDPDPDPNRGRRTGPDLTRVHVTPTDAEWWDKVMRAERADL